MKFFRFEKEKLRDLVIREPINFEQEFSEKERDALSESLGYATPQYLESSIQYYPNYGGASRVEISLFLHKFTDVEKLLKKCHKIVLGRYEVLCDFWLFAASKTKGLQLSYPRLIFVIIHFIILIWVFYLFSWGTAVNKVRTIKKDVDFDELLSEFAVEDFFMERVHTAHDKGFSSFQASEVQITRLITAWVSIQKI